MENMIFKDAFEAATADLAVCTAELVKFKEKTVELMGLVAKRDRQIFETDAELNSLRAKMKDWKQQMSDFAEEDILKGKKIEQLELLNEDLNFEISELKDNARFLSMDLNDLESENDDLANERDRLIDRIEKLLENGKG